MKFPASRLQLEVAHWKFEFSRPCKRCKVSLEFHRTPAGKLAPLETVVVDGKFLLVSHFETCPFADEFKKSAPGPASPAPVDQGDLFGGSK